MKQPSHQQIAMFGHIASALREVMVKNQWSVADLHHACGWDRNATIIYGYLGSRNAPSPKTRKRISKALHIPEDDLMARDLSTQVAVPAKRLATGPATHVIERDPNPLNARLHIVQHNPNPVLTFTVSADGTARIKLDAAMSLAAAAPLLRILLDAGLVSSTQGDDSNGS